MNLLNKKLPEPLIADFGQYRLNWREAGQGHPVVLLHGISSGSASWVSQLTSPSLTKHYHLYSWDAPGYLESRELETTTPTAIDYANALNAFIDKLALSNIVLVGHSLGAIMASAFASQYPNKVKGLILANPAQGYATKSPDQQKQVYQQRQDIVLSSGIEVYAQNRAAALLSANATTEKVNWVQQNMKKLNPKGFLAAAWMLAHDDISQYLNRYDGPLEILVGTEDTITPPAQVEQLARQKNCPYFLINQAGHASYLDAPDAFNNHLQQFLETLYCQAE
ncbi:MULTISPECIES: alpha/beta fold hydrolase [Providencia]|uniref:Alpha/beta hydrolase n=1 Tax=Providencia rettgeri TaxID=587 RepID=A0AB35LDA1_PRORE|nr:MULTISPECIES: alpha/beta hydrolase [Providencia]EHZ7762221.1 alpha/beta hydrolase [Providencia rettgeri]EIJ7165363.1 alpha/beta hydrolase [Providencia rettgeri]EJD6047553.1 alpha/beta hydrolase [Providencia rettgeri]EJD6476480.1 alpha/beta hydrolase [Providencia rettgeri]EKT59195.1 alpha/beta hydrolase [Providencia rettgeri Dmel1]